MTVIHRGGMAWSRYLGYGMDRKPFQKKGTPKHYAPHKSADVRHICLALSFDFKKKSVAGSCTTTVRALGGGAKTVSFDAIDFAIESCSQDGKSLRYDYDGRKLLVHLSRKLKAGAETDITVTYKATPKVGLYFIEPDKDYPDKHQQVWSQGQDEDSRFYFPCVDNPNEKATSEMRLTVPKDMYALSNGMLLERKNVRGGKQLFHWRCDHPHPVYLMSLAVGPFVEFTDRWRDVELSYLVLPGQEDHVKRTFAKTPQMLEFFSSMIGVDYPYERYAQVVVEDFVFGGMENITATTLTDATLHDAKAHLDYRSEPLISHELAHQWWGDLLTCRDWSQGWLNEGFATYFEALFEEHDLGREEFIYYMDGHRRSYLEEDAGDYRRPIVTRQYQEPIDLFDRHLYEKGSWVLHMLRGELGDDLWWQAVNHYCQENKYGNVRTEDLIRAFEETTGRNLEEFMDQWVFGAGHPELKAKYQWDGDGKVAVLSLEQTQKIEGDTHLFTTPGLEVHFINAAGKAQVVNLKMKEAKQTFYVPMSQEPAMVLLDPVAKLLKTLSFQAPKPMHLKVLADSPHFMARIQAARELSKDANVAIIEALSKALLNDKFWGVRAEVASCLGKMGLELAEAALLKGLKRVRHHKARRAVARALGEFRSEAVRDALAQTLQSDKSYFVSAEAALSLGKIHLPGTLDILKKHGLTQESHRDLIRAFSLRSFAKFVDHDHKALKKVLLPWTKAGHAPTTRIAAFSSLVSLMPEDAAVREELCALLEDKGFRFKMGALSALANHADGKYLAAIARCEQRELDGRLKRQAREAMDAIRARQKSGEELGRLRDDVAALKDANASLRTRLDKLESKGKKGRKK